MGILEQLRHGEYATYWLPPCNSSQGTEFFRDQPGLRLTSTLRRAAYENLRHPARSYKDGGWRNQAVYPVSSYTT